MQRTEHWAHLCWKTWWYYSGCIPCVCASCWWGSPLYDNYMYIGCLHSYLSDTIIEAVQASTRLWKLDTKNVHNDVHFTMAYDYEEIRNPIWRPGCLDQDHCSQPLVRNTIHRIWKMWKGQALWFNVWPVIVANTCLQYTTQQQIFWTNTAFLVHGFIVFIKSLQVLSKESGAVWSRLICWTIKGIWPYKYFESVCNYLELNLHSQ